MADIKEFQSTIGYTFQKEELLWHAMTHSSYANEKGMPKKADNERLEFLGDAVLELVSSDFLFHHYPDMPEGDMSKLRASLVCEPALADCANAIGLPEQILLGHGEELTGGRKRKSIVSDAMEALIGSIFLDGGFDAARAFVLKYVLTDIEHKRLFYDSKSALQEYAQGKYGESPLYELVSESGPPHNKEYVTGVWVDGKEVGRGTGNSKKSSEQAAAAQALMTLNVTK